jgi:hypothetical protein
MYCISCKKDNVYPVCSNGKLSEEDLLWKNVDGNINNEMVHDGIIHIIDAGYGSNHDGDRIIIAICDSCIKVNVEEGTLLYYDNYMPSDEKFIEQEREKSKKIFRRRKNLDDLTT